MTVSVPGIVNEGVLTQTVFPLYILLARVVSDVAVAEVGCVMSVHLKLNTFVYVSSFLVLLYSFFVLHL